MFTVTASLGSVVATLSPRATVPPPPVTVSALSATERVGAVDDAGVGVGAGVGVTGDVGSIWRPEKVFTAPERSVATPLASLMLAPLERLTPVMPSAEVAVSVDATVVRKVSALVPEPLT